MRDFSQSMFLITVFSFYFTLTVCNISQFFSFFSRIYYNHHSLIHLFYFNLNTITFSLHNFFSYLRVFVLLCIAIYDFNQTKHKAVNTATKFTHRQSPSNKFTHRQSMSRAFYTQAVDNTKIILVVNNSKAIHTGS